MNVNREAGGIVALANLLPDSKDAEIDEDASLDQTQQVLRALQASVAADSECRESAGTKLDVLVRIARLMAHDKVNNKYLEFFSGKHGILPLCRHLDALLCSLLCCTST